MFRRYFAIFNFDFVFILITFIKYLCNSSDWNLTAESAEITEIFQSTPLFIYVLGRICQRLNNLKFFLLSYLCVFCVLCGGNLHIYFELFYQRDSSDLKSKIITNACHKNNFIKINQSDTLAFFVSINISPGSIKTDFFK